MIHPAVQLVVRRRGGEDQVAFRHSSHCANQGGTNHIEGKNESTKQIPETVVGLEALGHTCADCSPGNASARGAADGSTPINIKHLGTIELEVCLLGHRQGEAIAFNAEKSPLDPRSITETNPKNGIPLQAQHVLPLVGSGRSLGVGRA